MRIAVVSCWNYRDCWPAFFAFFRKFWPDCPYPITLVVDRVDDDGPIPDNVGIAVFGGSWTENVEAYASAFDDSPILLMQEDFWLSHPVEPELIREGLERLETAPNVGAVRLYPCPGADPGAGNYGAIDRSEKYRTSCQATIWKPDYLRQIAEASPGGRASDFEIQGGPYASKLLPQDVLAFRREIHPWPVQYCCTAIRTGRWEPEAKALAELHGIPVDWSHRGFNAASGLGRADGL
jgi:hypothetical protein